MLKCSEFFQAVEHFYVINKIIDNAAPLPYSFSFIVPLSKITFDNLWLWCFGSPATYLLLCWMNVTLPEISPEDSHKFWNIKVVSETVMQVANK